MTPELSRPILVERIGAAMRIEVEANEAEREAVARRMGLVALPLLTCAFVLSRGQGTTVQAQGSLRARVVQSCVVTLEPFEAELEEAFAVRFVPEAALTDAVEIEDEDEIPYAGGTIDLGEATSEQLALALDPFPRKPGAAFSDDEADAPSGPFASLAGRRLLS
jgi:uncharacterized metal-binding protein YceD (DUF177 family)